MIGRLGKFLFVLFAVFYAVDAETAERVVANAEADEAASAKVSGAFDTPSAPFPSDYNVEKLRKYWGVEPLAYYPKTSEGQRVISLRVMKDELLGIDFVTYLSSFIEGDWSGCSPFVLNAVTNAEDAFKNDESRKNLIASAESYADLLCPSAKKILFIASRTADLDKAKRTKTIFFLATLQKQADGAWSLKSEKLVAPKISEPVFVPEAEKKLPAEALLRVTQLKDKPFSVRAAFAVGAENLGNLGVALMLARYKGAPVPAAAIVHIKTVEGASGMAWADKPFPILLSLGSKDSPVTIKSGQYYVIAGEIEPLSEVQKLKSGIRRTALAGKMAVDKTFLCKDEACQNAGDVIAVLKQKYGVAE